MKLQSIDNRFLRSKLNVISCFVFLVVGLLSTNHLEAAGWGKKDTVTQHEGIAWNEAYLDLTGLYLHASIPQYSGGSFSNGAVALKGKAHDFSYTIQTSFNPGFTPPGSLDEFVQLVQEANAKCQVIAVDSQKFGSKYVVDIMPHDIKESDFWRFLVTEDRLIKMGTDDLDAQRRQIFFDSVHIH